MSTKAEVHKFIENRNPPRSYEAAQRRTKHKTDKLREAIFSLTAAIEKSDETDDPDVAEGFDSRKRLNSPIIRAARKRLLEQLEGIETG